MDEVESGGRPGRNSRSSPGRLAQVFVNHFMEWHSKTFRKTRSQMRPLGGGASWPQIGGYWADFRGFREIQGGLTRFGVETFRAGTSKPFVFAIRNLQRIATSKSGDTFS